MGVNTTYRPTYNKVNGETTGLNSASTFSIALAAGASNTMTVTIQARNGKGDAIASVIPVNFWMADAATGIGLTAQAYSGNVTATSGAFLTALTAKKQFSAVTNASGVLVFTIVDTAKPATQYVVIEAPNNRGVIVSGASGTNWGA